MSTGSTLIRFLIGSILVVTCTTFASSHQESPTGNDVFLDTLQAEVEGNVKEAQQELVTEAKAVAAATEKYAKVKLAQNIFRALRVLVLKELEQVPLQLRMRQPRQEETEESPSSGSGDDEDTNDTSGGSSAETASTTKRTVPLIPVLAGILKSVLGGGENATTQPLNVTHTIQNLLFPLGNPFQGVQSLLNRRRPTAAPTTVIKYYPVPVYPTTEAPPPTKATTPLLRLVGRENIRVRRHASPLAPRAESDLNRQVPAAPPFQNPAASYVYAPAYVNSNKQKITEFPPSGTTDSPMLIYAPKHVVGSAYAPLHVNPPTQDSVLPGNSKLTADTTTRAPVKHRPQELSLPVFAEAFPDPTTVAPPTVNFVPTVTNLPKAAVPVTTIVPSVSGGTKNSEGNSNTTTTTPGLIYVDSLARDVQSSFDGLVKNLPDILKGAKEAIGLLANLREIFGEEDDA